MLTESTNSTLKELLSTTQMAKMKRKSPSFLEACNRYLDFICLNTSCHGGNWAMKVKSTKLKILMQFFVIFFACSMLGAVILQILTPPHPIFQETWKENDGTFPNVTLCSNRIFDKEKVQGLFV